MEYSKEEKQAIIQHYLDYYQIQITPQLLPDLSKKVASVPREIHNFVIKLRDFVVSKKIKILTPPSRTTFLHQSQIQDGGMMPIHKSYLEILQNANRPLGIKTLAVQLNLNEKTLEEDIEPLLLKL